MKKILLMILIAVIVTAGCSMNSEESGDKLDIDGIKEVAKGIVTEKLGENEQIKILREYYSFIEKRMDEDKILGFLSDNVDKLDEFRVDEMLLQLEGHLYANGYDTKGVLEKISPYLQNASEEIQSYFRIWNREVEDEVTDGENMKASADEILDRALEIEKHMEKFPDGRTKDRLQDLYSTYVSLGIKGLGNQYIYAQEGESKISQGVLEAYRRIIEENPDSRTARILKGYLDELQEDGFELNGENTAFFYDNIERIIESIK